jgi:hypothetical protein
MLTLSNMLISIQVKGAPIKDLAHCALLGKLLALAPKSLGARLSVASAEMPLKLPLTSCARQVWVASWSGMALLTTASSITPMLMLEAKASAGFAAVILLMSITDLIALIIKTMSKLIDNVTTYKKSSH